MRELKRNCTNCKHGRWDYQAEDFVCQNPNSAWFAEWVNYDMRCMQWKGYEDGQNRCDQMVAEDKNKTNRRS